MLSSSIQTGNGHSKASFFVLLCTSLVRRIDVGWKQDLASSFIREKKGGYAIVLQNYNLQKIGPAKIFADSAQPDNLVAPLLMQPDTEPTIMRHETIWHRMAGFPCLADKLPSLIYSILTNGKATALVLLGAYLMLIALLLPFWLLTFLISEIGVYALFVGTIFLIGRAIIRLIAFPGSSQKVTNDLEAEFAKYSAHVLTSSCSTIVDMAKLLEQPLDARTLYNIPSLYRQVQSYRDRILAVFFETLTYIYEPPHDLVLSSSSNGGTPASPYGAGFTKYGNNILKGDIGSLSGLTTQAKLDGRELLKRLQAVLGFLETLESSAANLLDGRQAGTTTTISPEAQTTAVQLREAASELRDFVSSLRPSSGDDENKREDPTEEVRQQLENKLGAAQTALGSILPMLDPPSHTSIFGFDVLRGSMLCRYTGARQFWVTRSSGGMIDVLCFPAAQEKRTDTRKALLYCNPNAGLIEVATGMNFSGGNIPTTDPQIVRDSWVDYYTELGYDVYLFNYAGYGRSYGTTLCSRSPVSSGDKSQFCLARVGRVFWHSLFTFKPTPDTLREDGASVAKYLINELGVEQLVVHGESIGGISAAGTARHLSGLSQYQDKLVLLICDRTFCNLEAIAQRLVGGWTGYAIRMLAPLWNTDVTGDFLAASCRKVVASDASDLIISEASSLKSGIALWKEIHRGIATTKGIGWIPETPLRYRMADLENCCVNDDRYSPAGTLFRSQSPEWPRDKHISAAEAFHFAACCQRIGKSAKLQTQRDPADEAPMRRDNLPAVMQAWISIGCCDGLTGSTLGVATKRGFDACVAWLCSCLVFGGQIVLQKAQERTQGQGIGQPSVEIIREDFDNRPAGWQRMEREASVLYPKPIPEVVEQLVSFLEQGDETIGTLSHEFQYVVGFLQYIVARLTAPQTIQLAQSSLQLHYNDSAVGCFVNLDCGHNNPMSREERRRLQSLLDLATSHQSGGIV